MAVDPHLRSFHSTPVAMASLLLLSIVAPGCPSDPVEATSDTDGSDSSDTSDGDASSEGSATSTGAASADSATSTGTTTAEDTTGTDETESDTQSDSSSDTGPGVCGDGQLDDGEICDDGNGNDHDDCPDGPLGTCQPATCDDGIVHNEGTGSEQFVDCGPGCPLACPSTLLLNELVVVPAEQAFVELRNVGDAEVDLSYVHLASFGGYYDPRATPGPDDLRVFFPAGATLPAGERLVVSLGGASAHQAAYGQLPDFDLDPADAAAPALEGEFDTPQLPVPSGMMVLFARDPNADLVQDIDYVVYGDAAAGMDKTGVMIGGSTYQDETPVGSQSAAATPANASTLDRCATDEPQEVATGGNSMLGHDETSEDLGAAFMAGPFPTPGQANACGQCLETLPSSATLTQSPEDYGGGLTTWGPQLGDLDGDGDLDAFGCRTDGNPHLLLFNDGDGTFTDGGFVAGGNCRSTGMEDLDGDGDLDLYINVRSGPDEVWFNDGAGNFTDSGQALGMASNSYSMGMGDVDGDGDIDAVIGFAGGNPNQVWLNDGAGVFSDSGQALGAQSTLGLALGDLDGDGDLDLFATSWNSSDRVFFNDGAGVFSDSGQLLDNRSGRGVGLGDLDGDGDLDAFVVNNGAISNSVWINDGAGTFSDSGQSLGQPGNNFSLGVGLGDLDGDGDLDAYVGNDGSDLVMLNDGAGVFSDSGQLLDPGAARRVALGDLDGDCDLDVFVANGGSAPDTVWLND